MNIYTHCMHKSICTYLTTHTQVCTQMSTVGVQNMSVPFVISKHSKVLSQCIYRSALSGFKFIRAEDAKPTIWIRWWYFPYLLSSPYFINKISFRDESVHFSTREVKSDLCFGTVQLHNSKYGLVQVPVREEIV